jgi:hypothetical protein
LGEQQPQQQQQEQQQQPKEGSREADARWGYRQ